MPVPTAVVCFVPDARIGALLASYRNRLNLTVDDVVDDIMAVLPTCTREKTVRTWFTDAPVLTAGDLRSVIGALDLSRTAVLDAVAPMALLPALWCRPLAAQLQLARESAGLSRLDVAVSAGISAYTVHRWEAASLLPRAGGLARLLGVLGLSAADLVRFGDWPPAELPLGARPAFGLWLRAGRAERSLSQGRMAKKVGVGQGALSAWETGRCFPAKNTWSALADKFTTVGMTVTVEQLAMLAPLEVPAPFTAPTAAAIASLTPFAALVTLARLGRRLSLEEAAQAAGVSMSQLSRWERGTTPAAKDIPALGLGLGIDVDMFTTALQATKYAGRNDRGSWLWARTTALGMGPREFAGKLGVHRNVVSFWTLGRDAVPEVFSNAIAVALDVSVAEVRSKASEPDTSFAAAGRDLRARRERAGLTQSQLAIAAGMTSVSQQAALSAYERGLTTPPAERAEKFAQVFRAREVALAA